MGQSMILITGGCSFSECISTHIDTWPRHLARITGMEHLSSAMGSQGNGLISRGVIHQVLTSLKTTFHNDILVGIAWSGPDRFDFYSENGSAMVDTFQAITMENPTSFIPGGDKNWVILNSQWRTDTVRNYYSTFHSRIGSLIYTLEHILRVQWFLKLHNIKYFMTTYTSEVLPSVCKEHTDLKALYDQIDLSLFLPTEGIYEWCRDYSNLPFPNKGDPHPSGAQHKLFTEQVIVPFIQQKGYI